MTLLTDAAALAYVGRSIGQICANHYDSSAENHCAHFVSHALGIQISLLCGDMMSAATRHTGATIRCNELFNGLPNRGAWEARPPIAGPVLIFVTFAQNVRNNIMGAMPSKHVGICITGPVYDYSNGQQMVVQEASDAAFLSRVGGSYQRARPHLGPVALFYAVPPSVG